MEEEPTRGLYTHNQAIMLNASPTSKERYPNHILLFQKTKKKGQKKQLSRSQVNQVATTVSGDKEPDEVLASPTTVFGFTDETSAEGLGS